MPTPASPHAGPEHKPVNFHIDEEHYDTSATQLTPRQLLVDFAGLDPAGYYLVEIRGHEQISYQDRPDIEIEVMNHAKFITASTGPTPVS